MPRRVGPAGRDPSEALYEPSLDINRTHIEFANRNFMLWKRRAQAARPKPVVRVPDEDPLPDGLPGR